MKLTDEQINRIMIDLHELQEKESARRKSVNDVYEQLRRRTDECVR